MDRKAIKSTMVFLVVYAIFSLFGTVFLVSWGHTNWVKKLLMVFFKFPLDWAHLIGNVSIWYLPLNILFWTVLYFFIYKLVKKVKA